MFAPPDYTSPRSFLQPRLAPKTVFIYLHRRPILDAVREAAPLLKGRLLDVGCGNKPYATLLRCQEHTGVDVATSPHEKEKFDYVYDGEHLPFEDSEFDSLLCTEVLEHCRDARGLTREIARVLKPEGYALVTVPMFIEHHEEPYDFQRLTMYGMAELAAQAHLEVVWLRPRGGVYATAIAALYLAATQTVARQPFRDLLLYCLWPFTLAALKLEARRPRSQVVSLGWQMLVKKL